MLSVIILVAAVLGVVEVSTTILHTICSLLDGTVSFLHHGQVHRSAFLVFLVATLVHFLSMAIDADTRYGGSRDLDTTAAKFASGSLIGCERVLLERLLSLGLGRLHACLLSVYFDLLKSVQLSQVLPFLRLNRLAVELSELRSGQGDDLVSVFESLNDWVA